MSEYDNPLRVTIATTGSLTDDVIAAAAESPQLDLFRRRVGELWIEITAEHFRNEVQAVAKGLLAADIQTGDRVVLISSTRYEWTLLDYAIWWIGAATVPIYETSSAEQMGSVLKDADPAAVIVETSTHADRANAAGPIQRLWQIDAGGVDELKAAGAEITDDELEARRAAVTPDSLATLIYTSGTTGQPKGCELTHGNFMFELGVAVDDLERLFDAESGASTLLFLPLAHVFARIIQVGAIRARVQVGHSSDASRLLDDLAVFQPTFILARPRVFEKVFNSASQQAQIDGRGKVFDTAVATAIAYSQALDAGKVRLPLRLRHKLFDRLVYARLRAALGGRVEYAVSGGAPLGERLGHFFRGVGVIVLEGYGLTETTAAVTANLPDAQRIGTVGRPLQGTSVRIAEDGEVLFKGGQVFRGYWGNPEATAAAVDADGWFHTGDMGEVDDDGFVRITGRKKEILVTAGGKNVAPAPLEDVIRAHALVSQALVVGEAKPFVAALVTLDPEAFDAWREQNGKRGAIAELRTDPDLVAEVQKAVDQANTGVSRAESVRKFAILADDWTEESGHVTPTMKLKRSVVMRQFMSDVEALYA